MSQSEPLSVNTTLVPRCPFHLLLQDQISKDNQMLETRHDTSGTEPLTTKIFHESSVSCGRSLSVRAGLQKADNDCRVFKDTGKMLQGRIRAASNAKTRSSKRLTLKNDYVSKRRYRNSPQSNRCSKPHTNNGPETGLTQEATDSSTEAASSRHQSSSTREHDTEEINPARESRADHPDHALDSVCLTEMEFETCKRLDILSKDREQHRTGGRRRSATVAKDQDALSAAQKLPEVEAKTGLPKDTLDSADFGTKSGLMLECSGDRMGGSTFRSCSGVKPNTTDEQTGALTSDKLETVETNHATRVLRSSSHGSPSGAETDLRTSEETNHRLKSVTESVRMRNHRRSKIQNSDQRSSFSSEEFKVRTQAVNTRNKNKSAPARLQEAPIFAPKNASSGSSRYDNCSQASLAAATSGTAWRMGTSDARSDRTGVKVKSSEQDKYSVEEQFNTRKPSYANTHDQNSVLPADLDSADSISDCKHRARREVSTQFEARLSSNLTENTKETLHSQTSESTAVVKQQEIKRESNDPSLQKPQTKPPRPLRSSTIIIETSAVDKLKVPDLVKDHKYGSSRTNSPLSIDNIFDNAQQTERLPDGKLSGISTFAGSAKNASACKVTRSSRHPSPTKSSQLRQNLRLPVQCHAGRSNRHRSATDRDRFGATSCTKSRRDNRQAVLDSYAKLEKTQRIPAEFKLEEICREVDASNGETNFESGSTNYSQECRPRNDSRAFANNRMRFSCVSEASRDTSTSTDILSVSLTSEDSRITSTRTDSKTVVCSARDLKIASATATEECFPRQNRKNGEKTETFVSNDPQDTDMKKSGYETVSYLGQKKGRSSPASRYNGGQEKVFRPTARTFLVSSPGRMPSQPHQHHPSKPIRRKSPKSVQNPKRTFLVGQSCLRKPPTPHPRNYNTVGHKPNCFLSLNSTFSNADCQNTNHADQEQRSEIQRKPHYSQDKNGSPQSNPQSSPKENLVTCSYPSKRHSDKIPVCQNTPSCPHGHSNSPLQSQLFCSTPVLGSTRSRSPLFFSPIPFLHPPKRPASLAKSHIYSPNMSYTISTSPITPSDLGNLQNPQPYDAYPFNSYNELENVSDGSKEATTKEKSPTEHTSLKNQTPSGCVVAQNNTHDTNLVVNSSNNKSSAFNQPTLNSCEEEVSQIDQSSREKQTTNEKSSPSVAYIFYKNHSQAVDAMLPNGRQSKIPQASWQPFHIIPTETDITSLRLRIHYHEVPPRSFRYSKSHRKAIEDRFPDCIRQLPMTLKLKRTIETIK